MSEQVTTIQQLAELMMKNFDRIDQKFEDLTEIVLDNFDRVENRLEKIEYDISGQGRRFS